jgi:predicted AAA+ superfamily ATPase
MSSTLKRYSVLFSKDVRTKIKQIIRKSELSKVRFQEKLVADMDMNIGEKLCDDIQ